MKFLPFTVSFSPTLSRIGLTELTVGAGGLVAARALAQVTSRALMSAPRQRTTRREFIATYFGRHGDELERRARYRTPCGTTRSPTCTAGVPGRNPAGAFGSPRSCPRRTRWAAARSDTAEIV